MKPEAAAPEAAPLESATWVDETLAAARAQNRVILIRFGRAADPQCQRCDMVLREVADTQDMTGMVSFHTVDVDEVPEFTYMYELYDPFAIMLFHKSKPLVLDAGHGPVRKLTGFSSAKDLHDLLLRAACAALEVPVPALERDRRRQGTADSPDDATTLSDEAKRLAIDASDWLTPRLDAVSGSVNNAIETSGGWLMQAEAKGWSALQQASENGFAAFQAAQQKIRWGSSPRRRDGQPQPTSRDEGSDEAAGRPQEAPSPTP